MGASESTAAKTNGATATEEEEERQQRPAAGASIATAAAGVAAGVAAWGISKMLSDTTDSQQREDKEEPSSNSRWLEATEEERQQRSAAIATAALGVAALGTAGWGISRMFSNTTDPLHMNRIRSAGGGFKMNTDGACRPNQGSAGGYIVGGGSVMRGPSGYGGILRDDRGKWVRGFRGFIGVTDCLTAEFHGIFRGLQLLDKLGIVDSILESDSDAAVDWINQESSSYSCRRSSSKVIEDCWEMIEECKRLKNKNRIIVSYCSRNDNKCADKLASMAIDKREEYVELMNPPYEIKDIVHC